MPVTKLSSSNELIKVFVIYSVPPNPPVVVLMLTDAPSPNKAALLKVKLFKFCITEPFVEFSLKYFLSGIAVAKASSPEEPK